MASQIPIKVMKDGSDNTCGLAQFTSSDSVAIAAGGTGLTSQGICAFVQPGLYAVGCQVTYLGICAGKADTGVGYDNTYVGHSAGIAVTTACRHTIIGSQAGKAITTCSGTVAIGYNAGLAQTFGDFNTLIGTAGGAAITTASNNTVIGYHAATATICSNNIAVGTCAMVANTQGQDNIAIGVKAGATQVAAGCNNVFIGSNAGAVSLCRDNISIGSYAGKAATTGGGNVMIGACVGYGVVGGAYNVYVGDKAGLANTSGNDNVFIGKCAGCATTGSCCLIIGNATGTLIAGDFNSGVVEINSAYCLPAADGSASQFLCTDGSGALAFATLVSSPWSTSGCFITTPASCFVGIGTTTPSTPLEISASQNAATTLTVNNATAGTGSYSELALTISGGANLNLRAHSSSFTTSNQYLQDGALVEAASTASAGLALSAAMFSAPILFYTNTAERMRIDYCGRVGLGVSPLSDYSNYQSIQMGPQGLLLWSPLVTAGGNSELVLGQNVKLTTAGGWNHVFADEASYIYMNGGRMVFYTAECAAAGAAFNGGETMFIYPNGAVTKPCTPAFLATLAADNNVTGDGTVYTVVYTTEVFDQGSDFSSTTFTAPVAGRYLLTFDVGASSIAATNTYGAWVIATSNRSYARSSNVGAYFPSGSFSSLLVAAVADMDAGDIACTQIQVSGGTKIVDVGALNWASFSGVLVA